MRSLHLLLAHIILQGRCPERIDHLVLLILLSSGEIGGLSNLFSKRRDQPVVAAIVVVTCGQGTLKLGIGISVVD